MENINSFTKLRAAILELEVKHTDEGKLLKEQFCNAFESIKPINLIKSTLKDTVESPEIRDKLINTAVSLSAGYLSKVIFETVYDSTNKKLISSVVQHGVRSAVSNNPEVVKSLGIGFLRIIINMPGIKVNRATANGTI